MFHVFSMLVLAFALSLDSFNVGITYGLRKIKIPLLSILVIAFCSGLTLLLSMAFGTALEQFISSGDAQKIGGWILIFIGAWALFQFLCQRMKSRHQDSVLFKVKIKNLGIVIQIFREPVAADIDRSGVISGVEAFLLGLALSLDAFGAGIGAVFVGYPLFFMAAMVACMSGLFLSAGRIFGYLFSEAKWIKRVSFLPGLLLILLGIWKI